MLFGLSGTEQSLISKSSSYLYLCNEHRVNHKGWYYFMSKSKYRRLVLDFLGSCMGWKNKYSMVGGNWGRDVELTKGWFKVPARFSRPGKESIFQVKVRTK